MDPLSACSSKQLFDQFLIERRLLKNVTPDTIDAEAWSWAGCVAGALEESTYRNKLSGARFEAIDLEPRGSIARLTRSRFLEEAGLSDDATIAESTVGS